MLRSYSSGELGHESFQRQVLVSPSKLPRLHFPCIARVFSRLNYYDRKYSKDQYSFEQGSSTSLNSYNRKQNSRGFRVSVGFKLQCHSTTLFLPTKCSISDARKKKYGGALPSILRSLESDKDLEKTLSSACENLSPKEQTVILKEQRNCDRVVRVFEFFKSLEEYVPNVIHYNIVLRALGRAQRWDELRLCWIEMAKYGVLPTNNTYGMLVDVYGKAGLVKEALLWIKHMRLRGLYPDEVTMSTVVRVLKDAGEFDRADRFYKDWCIGRVDFNDLELDSIVDFENESGSAPISFKNFLSTELFRTGGRSPVLETSGSPDKESQTRKPRLTGTYNTLIDLYGKAGRLRDAAEVFSEMLKSGVAMDTITFNTMIFTCGSHGHLSEAESLLNKMEERGIPPDTKTYNIFFTLYAGVGDIDTALEYYRKIRKVGLSPDIVTNSAVLHILCERKLVQEVETVIQEMDKCGMQIDEQSLPVLMKMYIDQGLLDQAKILFDKFLLNCELSSKTRAAIMDAYAEQGLCSEAEAVFYGNSNLPRKNKGVVEYNVMVKAYGKAKLYDKAFSLFRSMRQNGTWPDACTFNSLIQMFSGGELVDQARDLLGEMLAVGFKPPCLTFSSLIASYVRLGQVSDAVDVYQDMIDAGVKPNEVVYGALINGFAEVGDIEKAQQYFHMMEESGVSANKIVLTSLIKAYAKVGCLEGVQKVYEKMNDLEDGPDIIASSTILNLYGELGMASEARCVFDSLKGKGRVDGVSFAIMMNLYKSVSMLDEAIDVAEEMKQSGFLRDSRSYNQVMACYVSNGQLRECVELWNEMVSQNILPDTWTFKVLFKALKRGGMPIEAVKQLQSSYLEEKPYAREAVSIAIFSLVGLHDLALQSCEAFANAEIALESFVYNVAIYAYESSGLIDKALNMFMKMQDVGLEPDLVTYINLVACYGKAGMVEGVKKIYGLLEYGEIEPNESLFKAVIDAYQKANRKDLVELVKQEMKYALEKHDYSESDVESEEEEEDYSEEEEEDYSVSW
ncbi:hypothetical protein CCACVL1_08074 [Corchorus capsularis]|uniref:PROP1-like PPR domain-containing protein n=1 Tax=Corchorus capsularis TaxID=210143 RepID=A0A1R3J2C8_COCAP|nr:hypothetical protein CCACVL1_08074 [Corchorus capsularis]